MMSQSERKARYIMTGGFLGAGKTTAVVRLARNLTDRGLRVGLISNDQSRGLVDTAAMRSHGFAVEEIAGGCFCCRFNSLLDATRSLTRATRPDVFIAEPVGSCTDLIATVSYPLRRIYGDEFEIAPLSVLVDPNRAARILGLSEGRSFSEKVIYVYRKQLEEADIIVINKCDLLDAESLDRLRRALRDAFPRAELLACSARTGDGLEDWFGKLLEPGRHKMHALALDYARYADGEALLGWLNATAAISAQQEFDANAWLLDLGRRLGAALRPQVREIAHLKMTLDVRDIAGSLCVVSLVGGDAEPEMRETLADRVDAGTLVINLRAEGDPELMRRVTTQVLNECIDNVPGLSATIEHLERFRPAKPTPTHRLTVPV